MFKKGDIVWCTSHRYRITSYHRPCRVLGYNDEGKLLVELLHKSDWYDVDRELFELIPSHYILEQGQKISIKDIDYKVDFIKYLNSGYIQIYDYNKDRYKNIDIDRVILPRGWYV